MSFHRHHEKRKVMVNLFTIPMFIIILVVATFFNKPVRRALDVPRRLVLGTKDNHYQDLTKENFSKEIVNDTKDQIADVKENVLETTVGDILEFLGKSQRIVKDANSLQDQAGKLINTYTNFTIKK